MKRRLLALAAVLSVFISPPLAAAESSSGKDQRMNGPTPEQIITNYQTLLGATTYRAATAELAAQQLAAENAQLKAELEKLKPAAVGQPEQPSQ